MYVAVEQSVYEIIYRKGVLIGKSSMFKGSYL